eukprot:RCo043185
MAHLTGIEKRYDKASQRFYFVDHDNKTTSWEDPRLAAKVETEEADEEQEAEEPVVYETSAADVEIHDQQAEAQADEEESLSERIKALQRERDHFRALLVQEQNLTSLPLGEPASGLQIGPGRGPGLTANPRLPSPSGDLKNSLRPFSPSWPRPSFSPQGPVFESSSSEFPPVENYRCGPFLPPPDHQPPHNAPHLPPSSRRHIVRRPGNGYHEDRGWEDRGSAPPRQSWGRPLPRRRSLTPPPVPEPEQVPPVDPSRPFYCDICDQDCVTRVNFETHRIGKKHQKAFEKLSRKHMAETVPREVQDYHREVISRRVPAASSEPGALPGTHFSLEEVDGFLAALTEAERVAPGAFERFCRQRCEEEPGVTFADVQCAWLSLSQEERELRATEQKMVKVMAFKSHNLAMSRAGITSHDDISMNWQSLSRLAQQEYFREGERRMRDGEPPRKKRGLPL